MQGVLLLCLGQWAANTHVKKHTETWQHADRGEVWKHVGMTDNMQTEGRYPCSTLCDSRLSGVAITYPKHTQGRKQQQTTTKLKKKKTNKNINYMSRFQQQSDVGLTIFFKESITTAIWARPLCCGGYPLWLWNTGARSFILQPELLDRCQEPLLITTSWLTQ